MYLLEFAAQGVRGLSPTVRAALRPGYLVLTPAGAPPPAFAGLLSALLYADGRGGEASFAAPGQKGKAGITLLGNDQVTYRLVRERGGVGALHRLNKATNAFELVSEDAAETGQFLRSAVGVPLRPAFDHLFTFGATQLP